MGGKIRAYNQLAGLSEKLAESGREQELQNIIQETDEAYWQIVSLVNRQKLAVKFVETLQKFEHDIEVMYRTGVSTKADMLSVKVKLNQAEMALLRVEDGLSLARMNLNQICGLAVDSVYTLQEELLNVLPQAEPKWLNIEQVYDNRPEISSLTLATDIYRKKEKIARSAYLPTVAFMANYFAMTPSFFDGISTGFDGMWSVGIGVKAPIFHWGASRKTVRSARAETSLMNFKLQEAREKIELQVSQARLKVKEAARKMEVAEKNQVKADENLKYANLGFQEGTIPVSNVLEAQTAWLAAHADLIDTQIEMKLCEVYLQKAYGILGKE
jgi:outer membrane protein TolC